MFLSVAVLVNYFREIVVFGWSALFDIDDNINTEAENTYDVMSGDNKLYSDSSVHPQVDSSSQQLFDDSVHPQHPDDKFATNHEEVLDHHDRPITNSDTANQDDSHSGETQLEGARFDPPLYRQRYCRVADVLQQERVTTVVDLGCSEHKVIPIYKSVPTLESIVGVDLDLDALRRNRDLLKPLITDYLIRRPRPLVIRLYQGDAGVYDTRLTGTEAVTLIEVIEHLYPDTLQRVSHNVFSNIRPRLVVMTTPNSEYNVVFGDDTGFRHWDHKFEWTREEFQQWCDDQASMYKYNVTYSGIGDPPPTRSHIGHCSQMAVFRIIRDWSATSPPEGDGDKSYILVEECRHPHQEVTCSLEETVAMETNYYLRMLACHKREEEGLHDDPDCCYDDDAERLLVSPEFLLTFPQLQKLCTDRKTLVSILIQQGFELSADHKHILYSLPQDTLSDHSSQEDDYFPSATEELHKKQEDCVTMETDDWSSDWES